MSRLLPNVRLAIPAYNAASTLPALCEQLLERASPDQIVICDDGSTDKTGDLGRDLGVIVCTHPANRGKGAALRTAIGKAFEDPSVQAVITLDADGQHHPGDIQGMIDAWSSTGAEMVLGDRRIRGSGMPIHRRLSNIITSFLVSARTGHRILDSQCGFRLLSRRLGTTIVPESDGFEAETEWILRAASAGLVIRSVPVRTIYAGEASSMKKWRTTKAFLRVLFRDYTWED